MHSHEASRLPKLKKGQTHYMTSMGPALDALRAPGGPAGRRDISGHIAHELHLPPQTTEAMVKPCANRFHKQVQWARQTIPGCGEVCLISTSGFGTPLASISPPRMVGVELRAKF